MDKQRADKTLSIIRELKHTVNEQVAKRLELDMCERIIQRLSSFSTDCEECIRYFSDLEDHIIQLNDEKDHLEEKNLKHHKQIISNISSHLQQKHKLVTSGLYLSIYMSIGSGLGVVFGLLIFDNIALGLPLGIAMGVAIGAGLDEDAKKKGLTL